MKSGKRKARTHFGVLVLVIAVLALAYMGGYYALQRRQFALIGDGSRDDPSKLKPSVFYREDSDFSFAFFKPAHAIDRLLRPARWRPQDFPATDESVIKDEEQLTRESRSFHFHP